MIAKSGKKFSINIAPFGLADRSIDPRGDRSINHLAWHLYFVLPSPYCGLCGFSNAQPRIKSCPPFLCQNYTFYAHFRFNNGWVVKIGRGLDYFKNVPKYSLGYCDMDLRPCHETTVDIFHRSSSATGGHDHETKATQASTKSKPKVRFVD